jgi:hypothetical protein
MERPAGLSLAGAPKIRRSAKENWLDEHER